MEKSNVCFCSASQVSVLQRSCCMSHARRLLTTGLFGDDDRYVSKEGKGRVRLRLRLRLRLQQLQLHNACHSLTPCLIMFVLSVVLICVCPSHAAYWSSRISYPRSCAQDRLCCQTGTSNFLWKVMECMGLLAHAGCAP